MKLPGGLIVDGQLRSDFSFKPVTGALERTIAESGSAHHTLAQQVSAILVCCLDRVAGVTVDAELVRALSSGDRQYLIHQLEALIESAPEWYTSACHYCGELIQFQLQAGSLPVKPAGHGFPQTSLSLSVGKVVIRIPTGRDEENLATLAQNEASALPYLLNQLITRSDDYPFDSATLNAKDFALIDQSLEQMAPQPADSVHVNCPYCSQQQQIKIDSYAWITRKTQALDEEVHTLASSYHWSEQEILGLPRTRRQRYLQLIERNAGRLHGDDFMQAISGGGK
ncbi:MAG: hypothetical protein H8E21_11790 [Gammaproteobacteria bacterium]|nr:hypothetical protein [Gammaproteobacteria bacterium]